SVDNRDDLQWQTGALGAEKLRKGWELLSRLRKRFSPGSLAQAGQGKWYGGEPLPRWSLNSFWRLDGEPVWMNESLLADPSVPGKTPPNAARALLTKLAQDLGLSPSRILPAFEDDGDVLPATVTAPLAPPVTEVTTVSVPERKKPGKKMKETPAQPVGYVLPLNWSLAQEGWATELWRFEKGRLSLIEGDSPLGYRLALNDILKEKPLEPVPFARDPFDNLEPLPSYKRFATVPPNENPEARGAVRTAVCVQVREGKLHVFLPPLYQLEHFLELVAKVEAAAGALHLSVVLEGYEPPADSRLMSFRITPDPGVLEVNIHPAADWATLRDNTEIIYEEARQIGLTAVKFTVNGRSVGTGGGSHLVLGAVRPDQSPFF
ncbi:MAG TPA: transglutaminase family protein, partial [bacterium]|nr:transglutaminase family protein [bacterium]